MVLFYSEPFYMSSLMSILKEYLMSVFKSACLKDISKEKTKKVVCYGSMLCYLPVSFKSLFWRGLCEM